MAALTDNFMYVAPAGDETYMTGTGKAIGATSFTINSPTGWPTTTGFIVAIRIVDNNGNEVAGTYTEWAATLSGSTISLGSSPSPILGTDQVYPAAATTQVYTPASSERERRLISALLNQHNQDGTHNFPALSIPTGDLKADGGITFASLLATIFSGQVTSYANAGSAGGTFYYINLGGIKLLWGTSGNVIGTTAGPSYVVDFPAGFFSTIQSAIATIQQLATVAQQEINGGVAPTTSSWSVTIAATTTTGNETFSIFVIGT
jgi:hypothetical protein